MGRQWNPDAVSESSQLPAGAYLFSVAEIEETRTKDANKLMYVAQLEVVEPHEFVGLRQRDNFVIGSDADPDAEDPVTWSNAIGAKRAKQMFKAGRVPMQPDFDAMCASMVQQQVVATVVHKPDKADASRVNVNIGRYYSVGTHPVNSTGGTGAQVVQPAVVQAATVKPITRVQVGGVSVATTVKATAASKKNETAACPLCAWKGPKNEFGAHATTHDDDE